MFVVTRRARDGRCKVVDSDDGVEEYVFETDIELARSCGHKVVYVLGSFVDFEIGLAFILSPKEEGFIVSVVDSQSAEVLNSIKIGENFDRDYVPEIDLLYGLDINTCSIENHICITLSLFDMRYHSDDNDEILYYHINYLKELNEFDIEKDMWSK